MKTEFLSYLAGLDISSGPVCDKIERALKICEKICPDEIHELFISEYVQGDGSRAFENLFFLSPCYLLEAKQFLQQDDFDIISLSNLFYFEVQAQEYDFIKGIPKSRLSVTARFGDVISAVLRASGTNCDNLHQLLLTYFKPHLGS